MKLEQLLLTTVVNEHRSIANMIAEMISDYNGRAGVEIAQPVTVTKKPRRK